MENLVSSLHPKSELHNSTFFQLPIKAALANWKKVIRGGFFLVFPFLVFEKSGVVAAMAAWAEAVQG